MLLPFASGHAPKEVPLGDCGLCGLPRLVVIIPTDDLADLGLGETVETSPAGGVRLGEQFAVGRRAFALLLQQPLGVIVGQVSRPDRVKFQSGHGASPTTNSQPI